MVAAPAWVPSRLWLRTSWRRHQSQVANAALAGVVVAAVALMILPLPTWLLDLLLSANLAVAVSLLLVTLYVTDALKIASFPTVLLLTTLVRLALNVSSTRLILLQADAGRVIDAFGHFVVSGNYVVGGVIFLILAVIQFVVIAKGSERVAEVGARFALDAMPGKQAAIDSELREGSLDPETARVRRRLLEREGQFYGAMDGAMKFVKGDVIASFIITLVNLFGGLAVGVAQRGLAPTEALKRYGLLTIGDGLVSQIPALVLATAAGILVTRVASEDEERHSLGEELSEQLFRVPEALRVAGLFVGFLALVPGLPAFPFLVIAALLLAVSEFRKRDLARLEQRRKAGLLEEGPARTLTGYPLTRPWGLQLGRRVYDRWGSELHGEFSAASAFEQISASFFEERGIPLPPSAIELSGDLPPLGLRLLITEIPVGTWEADGAWNDAELCAWFVQQALAVLRVHAAAFIGIHETQRLLSRFEKIAPATVRQVVPTPFTLGMLTRVLRGLAREGVSIRDLKAILEALAQVPPQLAQSDPDAVIERVRVASRRRLSHDLSAGTGELKVFTLCLDLEETVRHAAPSVVGQGLELSPAVADEINQGLHQLFEAHRAELGHVPLLLTQADIRPHVRDLFEQRFPTLRVLSVEELSPEVRVTQVARLSARMLAV